MISISSVLRGYTYKTAIKGNCYNFISNYCFRSSFVSFSLFLAISSSSLFILLFNFISSTGESLPLLLSLANLLCSFDIFTLSFSMVCFLPRISLTSLSCFFSSFSAFFLAFSAFLASFSYFFSSFSSFLRVFSSSSAFFSAAA